jgi:tetratricopeptide (TPR) repeat protein
MVANARAIGLWGLTGLVALAISVSSIWRLQALPAPTMDVNMLFVPAPALVKGAATDFQLVIADGLWLDVLQYYGDRLTNTIGKPVNLGPMFDLITDLDPKFWFAYWLGSWVLGDNQEVPAALRLLEKGERLNPTVYDYPYQQGFIYFLFGKDYAKAAECFLRASKVPDAPRFTRTMAARMLQRQGLDSAALSIWQQLYAQATDKTTREIAKRNVERIQAELAGQVQRAFPIKAPHK